MGYVGNKQDVVQGPISWAAVTTILRQGWSSN